MKILDLLILFENLQERLSSIKDLQGAKFTYNISKNIDIIEKEVKHITKAIESSEKHKEYDEKRVELCKEFSKKDENGEVVYITDPNTGSKEFDLDTTDKKWLKAIDKLKEDYSDTLKEREKQVEDYNALLKEDSTVEFFTMSIDEIPEMISVEQMLLVKHFIK